jgi:glycosyltransferase involved in cell wall biosynthesis
VSEHFAPSNQLVKIIQILPELNAGGVERGTLELARHLVRGGHQSLVLSNGGRLVERLEKEGSRHLTLPVHRKSLATLAQIPRLREIFRREKPDIIHLRSRVPAWVAWLAWKSLPKEERPRLVTTVHGFYSVNAYSAVMAKGERVIAVSDSIREYILKNYPGTAESVIEVIHRGIEPVEYRAEYRPQQAWLDQWRDQLPEIQGKVTLVLAGRITRLKGHSDFFRLIADLQQRGIPAHGLVVGDTHPKKKAYMAELHAEVDSLGIRPHVSFLGHRSDLKDIMAVTDVVYSLSQQPESFGRTVLEALALGKPAIGYEFGGVGEILGRMFPAGRIPPNQPEQLLETSARIIDQLRCGEALEIAPLPEAFTLQQMCESTVRLYQSLLREKQ